MTDTSTLRAALRDERVKRIVPAVRNWMQDKRDNRDMEEVIYAVLAAAPQPAPADREALAEVIREARRKWQASWMALPLDESFDGHIADDLLARGLRLPGGEAEPRRCAECDCEGGEYECTWIKPGPDRDNALQQLADLGQQADRASETMAWAVIGEDGRIRAAEVWGSKAEAALSVMDDERVVRVAIRVVEDSDDAA